MGQAAVRFLKTHPASDEEVIAKVLAGDVAYFEILMRRHNELLYRVLRARLHDEAEVEDAMQQTYLNAYRYLDKFERRAKLSTWLVRIAIRESYARKPPLALQTNAEPQTLDSHDNDHPERRMFAVQAGAAIQRAADKLPEGLKMVFVLRDVQQLSTSETAACMNLDEGAVRVRLHRARVRLREMLSAELDAATASIFAFHAPRCNRVVAAVFAAMSV